MHDSKDGNFHQPAGKFCHESFKSVQQIRQQTYLFSFTWQSKYIQKTRSLGARDT